MEESPPIKGNDRKRETPIKGGESVRFSSRKGARIQLLL